VVGLFGEVFYTPYFINTQFQCLLLIIAKGGEKGAMRPCKRMLSPTVKR